MRKAIFVVVILALAWLRDTAWPLYDILVLVRTDVLSAPLTVAYFRRGSQQPRQALSVGLAAFLFWG